MQLARAFDVPLSALIDGFGYQPPMKETQAR